MQRTHSDADMENLRRKVQRVEKLGTVQSGIRALGMKSLFEWFRDADAICNKKSEFTHPLLRPYVFLPGLRAKMFYEKASFPWVERVEAEAPHVMEELASVLDEKRGFQPYRHIEDGSFLMSGNRNGSSRAERPDWNMFYFDYLGARMEENCQACPRTAALLKSIPRFTSATVASFSALNPGTNIPPHYGPSNAVVRVHLALRGTPGAKIRVGTQISKWEEGKLLFLNDAFEHQVWHNGPVTRFVLFFDVLHPDFRDDELEEVEAFLLHTGADGLTDFLSGMHQMRRADVDFLEGAKWWV